MPVLLQLKFLIIAKISRSLQQMVRENHHSSRIMISKKIQTTLSSSIKKNSRNLIGSKSSCRKEWWVSRRVSLRALFTSWSTRPSTKRLSLLGCLLAAKWLTTLSILSSCRWLGHSTSQFRRHWASEMTIIIRWPWFALRFGLLHTHLWLCGSLMTSLRDVCSRSSVWFPCSCIHLV